MRTVTEFAAPTLRNAAKIQQELQTSGKTAEEMPAALGEALKLEGDKLNHLIAALEVAGPRLDDLKRVLVLAPANESEKAPHKAVQKGEHWLMTEYFPPVHGKGKPAHAPGQDGRDSRGGDRKGKRRGKGRGERGDRGDRSARGDRTPREGAPTGGAEGAGGRGEKREGRGPRRPPRGPRPPRAEGVGAGAPNGGAPEKPPVPSSDPNAPKIAPKKTE